ncbi:hypothetical protein Hdeb2414_s0135g00808371 [Helianthus debilis subsp. tardiflorus]
MNDAAVLQDHGLRNRSEVNFIPYVMSRTSKQHSRWRKHRKGMNCSSLARSMCMFCFAIESQPITVVFIYTSS